MQYISSRIDISVGVNRSQEEAGEAQFDCRLLLVFRKTVLCYLSSCPKVLKSHGLRLRTPCVCPSRYGTIWPGSWCSEVWGEDSTPVLWTGTHSPLSQRSSSLGRMGVWVWFPASVRPCIWSLVLFWCTCTCTLLHSGQTWLITTEVTLRSASCSSNLPLTVRAFRLEN